MSVNWWLLEQRKPPSAKDIAKQVKKAKNLPDAGDHGHVPAVFPIENKAIPPVPNGSWDNAKQKTVKLKDLFATNQQLDRQNLVWHLSHPGMSRFKGPRNTHPQVVKRSNGNLDIVDGHHRLSALRMLGVKKETVWLLKEKDL